MTRPAAPAAPSREDMARRYLTDAVFYEKALRAAKMALPGSWNSQPTATVDAAIRAACFALSLAEQPESQPPKAAGRD